MGRLDVSLAGLCEFNCTPLGPDGFIDLATRSRQTAAALDLASPN